jgi:hypothetical protein
MKWQLEAENKKLSKKPSQGFSRLPNLGSKPSTPHLATQTSLMCQNEKRKNEEFLPL